jgi:hypothetical protein
MNLAIVGSPSFEDYARFTKRVEEVLAERGIMMSEVQVISCGSVALAGAVIGIAKVATRIIARCCFHTARFKISALAGQTNQMPLRLLSAKCSY